MSSSSHLLKVALHLTREDYKKFQSVESTHFIEDLFGLSKNTSPLREFEGLLSHVINQIEFQNRFLIFFWKFLFFFIELNFKFIFKSFFFGICFNKIVLISSTTFIRVSMISCFIYFSLLPNHRCHPKMLTIH